MGKRKVKSESNLENMVLPSENDVLGTAVKMLGSERVLVKCQDGKERLCRVRGKRARYIFWRYRKNQANWLIGHGYLKM